MSLFLDHLFLITEPKAVVGDRLLELGFKEGPSNVHPGQGTANRRFFFEGFVLELLYINDNQEAAKGAGHKLRILERSFSCDASPFGLVVRATDTASASGFPNWQYFPDYFKADMSFNVGSNSELLAEPACICMPFSLPAKSAVPESYANLGWRFSGAEINTPVVTPSTPLKHFADIEGVRVHYGKPHHMHLKFNNIAENQLVNLTPDLPLSLAW